MNTYVVSCEYVERTFTPVEDCKILTVPDTVLWDNNEVWEAPYSQDELANILEGVMWDEDCTEIKILTVVPSAKVKKF